MHMADTLRGSVQTLGKWKA